MTTGSCVYERGRERFLLQCSRTEWGQNCIMTVVHRDFIKAIQSLVFRYCGNFDWAKVPGEVPFKSAMERQYLLLCETVYEQNNDLCKKKKAHMTLAPEKSFFSPPHCMKSVHYVWKTPPFIVILYSHWAYHTVCLILSVQTVITFPFSSQTYTMALSPTVSGYSPLVSLCILLTTVICSNPPTCPNCAV